MRCFLILPLLICILLSCVGSVVAGEIRKLTGKYLVLRTDLPASPAVDELPAVFDAAVPLWCERLGIDPEKIVAWKMNGCLIDDFEAFRVAGLVKDVPRLRSGYQYDFRLWIREQPSDYYRRHLLLHEGVHGLMAFIFRGLGPSWFREGTAELLATHTWEDGRLTLIDVPASREAVPMWGRIKLIRDDIARNEGKTLEQMLRLAPEAYDDPDAYAWSWAFCVFLEAQEPSREILKKMVHDLPRGIATPRAEAQFNERFKTRLGEEAVRNLAKSWIDFAGRLEYGYDVQRTRIDDFTPGTPLDGKPAVCRIRAERGWQNSGVRVHADERLTITATGRFQLNDKPAPWMAEPNGITLKYHAGLPIGQLLATVVPEEEHIETDIPGGSVFLQPVPIGYGREWIAPRDGTLFFRVNDSPADLANNAGQIEIRIVP